jgi:hypothetical protein
MWCSTVGVIVTLSILAAPLVADAQPATKVSRIGRLITGRPLPAPNAAEAAFRQSLRELGYDEGQNLVLEYR